MPKKHVPHADDALRRQTKSLSIDRRRSFYIVHPDGRHDDAWSHLFTTTPPTRMQNKNVERSAYAPYDAPARGSAAARRTPCPSASRLSAYQPRSTDLMAAWISARTLNFCVMSMP